MRWILLPKNVLLASSTARSVTRQLFIVIFVLLLLDWNITSSAGEGHIRHQDILHSDSIIHVYGGSLGRVEHRPTPKVGNRREPSLLSVIQTHISTETSRQSATDFARHETVRTEAKDGTKRRRADQQHHKGKETVMANTMKKPDESSDKERDRRGDNKHSTDHNGNGASSDGDDDSDRMNIQGDKSGTDPHMGGEEQGGNRRVGTEASGPDTRQSELIIITNRITPTLAPELGQVEGPITSVRSMSVPWYDNALPHTNSDANDGPPHSTEMTSRKDTIMPLVYRPVYLLHPNTPPSPPHREKEKGEKDDSANDINGDSTGRAEIISIDPVFADNEYSLGTHALLSTPQTTGEPVSTTGPAFYSLSVPTPPSVNPLSPPSLDDEL